MEINLANIPLNKDTLKYGTAIAAVLASSVGIGVWTLNHLADCKVKYTFIFQSPNYDSC